jgi:hypothetical protein
MTGWILRGFPAFAFGAISESFLFVSFGSPYIFQWNAKSFKTSFFPSEKVPLGLFL